MAGYDRYRSGWVSPQRKGYKFRCCDCYLVHTIDFRIKDHVIQFRVERDDRATAASRRGRRPK